jgi:ABC-type iron transport system FetAB ATPase subunit
MPDDTIHPTPPDARLRTVGLRSALAGPFDIAVAAGECIAITGASGSGKSLLLRLIADLDPGEGEVFLDGIARSSIAAPAWRREVAYVAAESGWWNEAVAPHFPDIAAARAMAEAFALKPELFDGLVLRLSTGEKQRLALLDKAGEMRVEAVLAGHLARGCAMVLVTHDPGQATRLGKRQFVMQAGKLNPA